MNEPLVKYRLHSDQICRVHPDEQETFAVSVSRRNLENLGIVVNEGDLIKLRQWERTFPEQMEDDDVVTCKILLTVLDAFKNRGKFDKEDYKKARRERISRICRSIGSQNFKDILFSGLLLGLIAKDTSTCVSHFSSRIIKRWNRRPGKQDSVGM